MAKADSDGEGVALLIDFLEPETGVVGIFLEEHLSRIRKHRAAYSL